MSRLTIAIPTFRRPEDLKRAVSGVLEQAGELVAGPTAETADTETGTAAGSDAGMAGAAGGGGGGGRRA